MFIVTENKFPRRMDAKLFLSVLATGLLSFTGVVIETAMNITFPTLITEFAVGLSTVQWITTGYLLVLAIVIPTSPFIKKKFHGKGIFLSANLIFAFGTILGFWAPSFDILLSGRVLQGAGTGLALPLMFNIVMEQAPTDKIGLMMGTATLTIAMAPAIGPSVGGWIVANFGWRMIFTALLPILLVSFFCGAFSIRQSSPLKTAVFPWKDYILLSAGFVCFISASSFAGSLGWTDPLIIGLFAGSATLLTLFCRLSMQTFHPLIHLQVFRRTTFSFCVGGLLLLQFICLGLGFLIPNFAQIVLHENVFTAGCILLPGCLLGAFLSPLSGKLLDTFGPRKPLLTGCFFVLLSILLYNLSIGFATALLMTGIYAIFTLGQGFTAGNSMVTGLAVLPHTLKADGNAVFNTIQQLAGAIGTSIIATVVSMPQEQFPENLSAATYLGSQYAFALLLLLSIFQFVCLALATKPAKKDILT